MVEADAGIRERPAQRRVAQQVPEGRTAPLEAAVLDGGHLVGTARQAGSDRRGLSPAGRVVSQPVTPGRQGEGDQSG